jgi:hypothetical protein
MSDEKGYAVCYYVILLFVLCLPAIASNGAKTAELFYRDIKIKLNGRV